MGRRTLLIGILVACVATLASFGIGELHHRAGHEHARYAKLLSVEAGANRVSTLEWQATARREVPLPAQAEAEATLRRMATDVATLSRAGVTAPQPPFSAYRPAVVAQFADLRSRQFAAAERIDATTVDPAYDALNSALSTAAADSARQADRSERLAHKGSIVVTVLATLALTALLALLERADRRRRLDGEFRRLAYEDSLTGLSNRAHFEQRTGEALARDERALVVFLDLDDFKQVNDSLGHAAGDRLLAIAGERLRHAVREGDLVARLGGDEFAILALEPGDPAALVKRLFEALSAPVSLEGKRLHLRASIGVATTEAGAELLRNADLAMYAAKAQGKDRCAVFTDEMHVHALARLDRREELERAIEDGQIVLHYQRIVDLDLGRTAGFEALARWNHPERGLLGPGEFIPLAEETGLIVPLGRCVLAAACRDAARWAGAPYLSVNVASAQLEQPGYVAEVAEALADAGLPAGRLVLEVTESSLVGDAEAERLQALRRLGVRLAIDDFGTGYSSLSYLRRFPMDVLKIDRSFTCDVASDPALLQAIVAMGESLGLILVPEGIEEPEQAEALRELGCQLGQGFYFGRPVPAAELSGVAVQPA